MPLATSIRNQEANLTEAIKDQNWDRADRARDRLTQLLVRAVKGARLRDLKRIENVFREAYRRMALMYALPREHGVLSNFWGALAQAQLAEIAQRYTDAEQAALTTEQMSVRDKILLCLNAPGRRMTNRELAVDPSIVAAEETVARALADLRDGGLVMSWRAGKAKLNQLTPEGYVAANELRQRTQPSEPRRAYEELAQSARGEVLNFRNQLSSRNQRADPRDHAAAALEPQ